MSPVTIGTFHHYKERVCMTATAQLMRERSAQHFINGDYQAGRVCVSTIINPATEQPVGDYAEATAEDMEQAIALANDSEMGLGASIYTENLAEAMRAINEIESGIVWVNTPLNDNDCVPFGGRKMTGTGRELGVEGLEQFRRSKMVMIAPRAVDDPEWFPYPQADAFPATTARVSASAILGAGELGQ
ncbi:aldehyde dehydrogenase family protein [Pseudomonas gingeri]|uniref:aldehyde dehydrogenase family protein n=1 Tax=Pseudomonas gingeri TaxID=117681 RepID=UPI00210C7F4D|nr:aldehyde dehydrogenase family protein [Pseudomonas gingeri]